MPKYSIRNVCTWLVCSAVALIAFNYGYEFGLEVSGVLLGVIAGANCAIFAAAISDALLARILVRTAPDAVQE